MLNCQVLHVYWVLVLPQFSFAGNQNVDNVQKCTYYKKYIFEKEITFGALFYNAPLIRHTVDNCQAYIPLIVAGSPADPKEFPIIGRIGIRENYPNATIRWVCGGTLISEKFVLTAAHCFEADEKEMNVVRLGDLDFSTDMDDASPKDYSIKNYIIHENFESPALYNDIGLIELSEEVKFDFYKHPACLPFDDSDYSSFIAIGWGSTVFAGKSSDRLLKVLLDRFDAEKCKEIVDSSDEFPNGYDETTQICVGSDAAKDTCNGDSGGPLLVYHKDYRCMYHVIGITSASIGGCGTAKVPGIYTRIYYYLDWIKKHMTT